MNHTVKKQFVTAEHTTADGVHWDLMLETDGTLRSWRLNTPPQEIKRRPVPAERIFDHSLRFLTYEGPVQDGTGQVKIVDHGTYQIIEQTKTSLVVAFEGQTLSGTFRLRRLGKKQQWELEQFNQDSPNKCI